jgi:hypothetical protein
MRDVLVELRFKVHRGMEAVRAVEPRPVVKDLDPLEDGGLGFGAGGEGAGMDQAAFQGAPEAFHEGQLPRRLMLGTTPAWAGRCR